jgi:hypothetical protein
MTASYDFVQLDVFTRATLAGNPLAVFTDARGLTDKPMQALARETSDENCQLLPTCSTNCQKGIKRGSVTPENGQFSPWPDSQC